MTTKKTAMTADVKFFYDHAGFSWKPNVETREEGRLRCAQNYAAAEGIGRNAGLSFVWAVDPDVDSRDFSNARPSWQLWECCMYDAKGALVDSMGGVDFGRCGSPHGSDYRRVVEAELAAQHVDRTLESLS